jgi:hypothetical protein
VIYTLRYNETVKMWRITLLSPIIDKVVTVHATTLPRALQTILSLDAKNTRDQAAAIRKRLPRK